MRTTLLLLVVAVCLLPVAWGANCQSANPGCSSSGIVEVGYVCPDNEDDCQATSSNTIITNSEDNLLLQLNFNDGIHDISSNPTSFPVSSGFDIGYNTNGGQIGFASFSTSSGAPTAIISSTDSNSKLPTGDAPRSFCFWVQTNSLSATITGLAFGGSDQLNFGLNNGKFTVTSKTSTYQRPDTIALNTWEHYCATYSSSGITSYRNGASTDPSTFSPAAFGPLNSDAASTITVGAQASTSTTTNIFDVRVYSAVLSGNDVAEMYNSVFTSLAGISLAECGDGQLQLGEQCDDNNYESGDGCFQCIIESGFTCVGAPSHCMEPLEITASQASGGSTITTTSLDVSAVPNPPSGPFSSRVGEFVYRIGALKPFASYQLTFVFAETQFSAAKARVFDVSVNGVTPAWSPIDVFATAGSKNKAILKTFTGVADISGAITASFTNNAIITLLRVTPVSDSVSSGGLTVKGSDSSVVFNPSSGFDEFTMETFVYTSSVAAATLIQKGGNHQSYILSLDGNGFVVSTIRDEAISSTAPIELNQWNHIAVVSKAGVRYTYINGALDSQAPEAATEWVNSNEPLYLGRSMATPSLPASWFIDNVRLWERALSSAEVRQNALPATQPALYGLIEGWNFSVFTAFGAEGILYGDDTRAVPNVLNRQSGSFFESNAVSVVSIDCGSQSDKFYVGGSADAANSLRKGAFTYTVTGLRPRQSYEVAVATVSTTSKYSFALQHAQIVEDELSVDGTSTYTMNADARGVITLEFTGSAAVDSIVLTPVRAPLGSARFVVFGERRATKVLEYEFMQISGTQTVGANGIIEFDSEDDKARISVPYQGAAYSDSDFDISVGNLVPGLLYSGRAYFARIMGAAGDPPRTASLEVGSVSQPLSSDHFVGYIEDFEMVADSQGMISATISGKAFINAIQFVEAARIFPSSQAVGVTASSITVWGTNFNSLGATPLNTPNCIDQSVFDDHIICFLDAPGVAEVGPITASLTGGSDVVVGVAHAAPTVAASASILPKSSTRLVITGTGFYSPSVKLSQSGAKCVVTAFTLTQIVCKVSGLGVGVLKAIVSSGGAPSDNVQVAVVKAAPQVSGVQAQISTSSSTAIFKGKDFAPSPNHAANVVILSQQSASNSRKRAVGAATSPSCAVIYATPTAITCALSGVVAGPLQVTITVNGGASNTFVVNVASTPAASSLACKAPTGMPDAFMPSMCNCWSGYAPSDKLYKDCDVNPFCPQEIVDYTSTGPSFGAPITTFANDQLTIVQSSPVVLNRRDTYIRFNQGSASCGYPGSLWSKTVDKTSCRDVYTAVMPWSGKSLCGFVRDNSTVYDNQVVFNAQMDTTFISAYFVNGRSVQRVTTESHIVTVSFAKTATIAQQLSVDFAETTETDFVNVVVETTSWDPTARVLSVTITAEAVWPYMLNMTQLLNGTFAATTGSSATVLPTLIGTNDMSSCTQQDGSLCEQTMTATLTVIDPDVCDIAGEYTFAGANILCRDVVLGGSCPGEPTTTLQFDVDFTNFCDEEAADPSADIVPVLNAFSDAAMTESEDAFEEGEQGYFSFTVVSEYATIDSIAFTLIRISSTGHADDNIFPSFPNPEEIKFSKKDVTSMVPPGLPASAGFTFAFDSNHLPLLHTLRTLSGGESSSLTITAIADIHFHGNDGESRKRSVELNIDAFSKTAHGTITFVHGAGGKSNYVDSQFNEKEMEVEFAHEYQDKTGELWAELKEDSPAELGDWFKGDNSGASALTSSTHILVSLLLASLLIVHMILL